MWMRWQGFPERPAEVSVRADRFAEGLAALDPDLCTHGRMTLRAIATELNCGGHGRAWWARASIERQEPDRWAGRGWMNNCAENLRQSPPRCILHEKETAYRFAIVIANPAPTRPRQPWGPHGSDDVTAPRWHLCAKVGLPGSTKEDGHIVRAMTRRSSRGRRSRVRRRCRIW